MRLDPQREAMRRLGTTLPWDPAPDTLGEMVKMLAEVQKRQRQRLLDADDLERALDLYCDLAKLLRDLPPPKRFWVRSSGGVVPNGYRQGAESTMLMLNSAKHFNTPPGFHIKRLPTRRAPRGKGAWILRADVSWEDSGWFDGPSGVRPLLWDTTAVKDQYGYRWSIDFS